VRDIPPDGHDKADEALQALVDEALPTPGSDDSQWTIDELRRLAVLGRLTGDISGAVSAHRVLSDALGALKGGYADKRKSDHDMTDEEAERHILDAAEHIRAKRKLASSKKTK
jgi:hypothetical protein